jgi:hypothetical protein
MIERNVDLTSRDVARSAPDGLTLSGAQRPERTRAEPPIWRKIPISQHIVRAAPERLFCSVGVCQYSPPDPNVKN